MSNNLPATIPVSDIRAMAAAVVKSNLFGIKSEDQAMSLMLIAQAEGLHPALAARDYHVIQGRPALKADAMLARFQQAGGKVEWHALTDERVAATFSHPSGGSATIDWDMARAKAADIGGKDMWKKYPRQMLRARVVSEGIRTVFPGVVVGVYTPEEVQDFDDNKRKPAAQEAKQAEYAEFTPVQLEEKPASPIQPQQIEPPVNPETGEVSPHAIKLPEQVAGWSSWAQQYAAAIKSAKNTQELDTWMKLNGAGMSKLYDIPGQLHKRLYTLLEKRRAELQPAPELQAAE